MLASIGTTFAGLCVIAIGTSLFTGRGLAFSIVRQSAITAVAAAITFGVGHLLGAAITG
jgi:VIT1/CCC1 family predicted Fe2+/Mn2+ transporter